MKKLAILLHKTLVGEGNSLRLNNTRILLLPITLFLFISISLSSCEKDIPTTDEREKLNQRSPSQSDSTTGGITIIITIDTTWAGDTTIHYRYEGDSIIYY